MAYQVAMPRSGMDNQRTILNIIARDETRLDTLSDDGMPCEMDNQLQEIKILYLWLNNFFLQEKWQIYRKNFGVILHKCILASINQQVKSN